MDGFVTLVESQDWKDRPSVQLWIKGDGESSFTLVKLREKPIRRKVSTPDTSDEALASRDRRRKIVHAGGEKRYWLCHWQKRFWRGDVNVEHEPIRASGSNRFGVRRVRRGDVIFVVSQSEGQLMLGGRLTVGKIVSRAQAVRTLKDDGLYDASDWAIALKGSGSPLRLHRRLAPDVSRQLMFVSEGNEPRPIAFTSRTKLDRQSTRGVRELTPESAALLERIIEFTDRESHSPQDPIAVSRKLLKALGLIPPAS